MASGETGCIVWGWHRGRRPTAEDVIDRGGIVQTLRGGNPESATVADLPNSNLGRDLAEAEAEIADTKRAYYDALNRRHRARTTGTPAPCRIANFQRTETGR